MSFVPFSIRRPNFFVLGNPARKTPRFSCFSIQDSHHKMLLLPKKLILPLLLVLNVTSKAEPFGAISYLTPSEIPLLTGTPPSILWFGVAGKTYSIEWSSDLLTWNSTSQTYTGNNAEFNVPLPQISSNLPSEKCFFRTKVQFEAADFDLDGLANSWEMHFFGNTSQGANDDWDDDGISNGDEARNNSNPTDPIDGLNRPELVIRSIEYEYDEEDKDEDGIYEVNRIHYESLSLVSAFRNSILNSEEGDHEVFHSSSIYDGTPWKHEIDYNPRIQQSGAIFLIDRDVKSRIQLPAASANENFKYWAKTRDSLNRTKILALGDKSYKSIRHQLALRMAKSTAQAVTETRTFLRVAGNNLLDPPTQTMTFTIPAGKTGSNVIDVHGPPADVLAGGEFEGYTARLVPVEIKATSYGSLATGLSGKYNLSPKAGSINNLISIWPNEQLKININITEHIANNLPPNFIKWDAPSHTIPDQTIEHTFSWSQTGIKIIRITIGEDIFKIVVDVPEVGTISQGDALLSLDPITAASVIRFGIQAMDYSNDPANFPTVTPKKDAIRHSYWTALCASDILVDNVGVLLVSTAHEYNNKWGISTFGGSTSPQQAFNTSMDLRNNYIGLLTSHITAIGTPDRHTILQDLHLKYQNGQMWIYDGKTSESSSEGILSKSNEEKIFTP